MITEDDIVANCRQILIGEKARIQRDVSRAKKAKGSVSRRDLDDITSKTRFYLRALHSKADQLVDSWVAEALQ